MPVTQTDINNANIDLQNKQIALNIAQSNYQQSQSLLNQLLAQQAIDNLNASNNDIVSSMARVISQSNVV